MNIISTTWSKTKILESGHVALQSKVPPSYGSSESQPTLAQPTILLAQIIPHQILRFCVGKEFFLLRVEHA